VSGSLKGDDKKLELWVNGRSEIYTLEAKNKQVPMLLYDIILVIDGKNY
jgi:hypothetical protein